MLELKRAGLYIANGKSTSVLIRVAGEVPYLTIVSGVLLNDMERDGTVTVLDTNSPEIQDIICNPRDYVFDKPTVSEAVYNEAALNTESAKVIEYKDEEFDQWVEMYYNYIRMYKSNYIVKMQVMLISKGYSKSQADLIIKQICSRLRSQGRI